MSDEHHRRPTATTASRKLSLRDRILGRVPPGSPQLTEILETQDRRGQPGDAAPGTDHQPGSSAWRSGSVLRLPEGVQLDRLDLDVEAPEDETMILNLGPVAPLDPRGAADHGRARR